MKTEFEKWFVPKYGEPNDEITLPITTVEAAFNAGVEQMKEHYIEICLRHQITMPFTEREEEMFNQGLTDDYFRKFIEIMENIRPNEIKNPVVKLEELGWGFWDNTWSKFHGGYKNERDANDGLKDFCKNI